MNVKTQRGFVAAIALILAIASTVAPARADIVSLVADNVAWDAGNSPDLSPDMTFKLFNVLATGDLMTGWQLRLRIVPEAGATGTIHFHDAFQPAANYIFDGRTDGISGGINAMDDTKLFSYDTDNMFVGVVPDTDKTLLSVNFFTNDAATGSFAIQALGNLGDTQWSAAADPTDRDFANVAFDNTWVTIANVRIIPEPSSIALMAAAIPSLLILRRSRTARR